MKQDNQLVIYCSPCNYEYEILTNGIDYCPFCESHNICLATERRESNALS